MYLTSHRVRTDHGLEGINSSLYLHGAIIDDPEQMLEKLEADPGVLKAAACAVAPGNNPVLAYLDVCSKIKSWGASSQALVWKQQIESGKTPDFGPLASAQ